MKKCIPAFFLLFASLGSNCPAVANLICNEIGVHHPYASTIQTIDQKASMALSDDVSSEVQQEIVDFHQRVTLNTYSQRSSKVKLILSGGTRPSSLITRENHRAYAAYRGIRYRFVYPIEFMDELLGKQKYWMKVFAIKMALECDNIAENDWIVWIDDDVVIDDYHTPVGMLDKYIDHFGNFGQILVAEDNDYEKVNTGILLVKKTAQTRSFFHMWSLYSNDPIKGYQSQQHTLHEQQALKELMENSQFNAINEAISLIKIVQPRYEDFPLNLNTFKREKYLNSQPWFTDAPLNEVASEGMQTYQPGDSFIHHGTKQHRTRLIMESLVNSITSYEKVQSERPWGFSIMDLLW